jgi:YesN/AraC family two-component response regulator
MDRIFDKFFVTDDTQQDKFSSGIGLAFSRQLAVIMNGQITPAREQDGVSFLASFPLNTLPDDAEILSKGSETPEIPSVLIRSVTAVAEAGQAVRPAAEQNKYSLIAGLETDRKSILIVEDDAAIRYLLRDLFKDYYIVYEVENGDEALAFLLKTLPSIIISDIMMPGMNGLDLCNRVKNTPRSCHIPFILLSARGMVEHQTEGYETGADAYITKPFHTSHLLVRVRKLLEYRERMINLVKKNELPAIIGKEQLAEGDLTFIRAVTAVIEEDLTNTELNAAFIESRLHLSKMQLYRKLKSKTDMTPAEFIKLVRLQKAAYFLRNTDMNVQDVFYNTGFNNQSYFFREFKKMYECSPNEYRASQNLPTKAS